MSRLNDDGSRPDWLAALTIDMRTQSENLLKVVTRQDLLDRYPGVNTSIEDNGIKNSGELISNEEAEELGKEMTEMDWIITIGSEGTFVEAMTHSEFFDKYSFKITKIRALRERKNSKLRVLRESYYDDINQDGIKLLMTKTIQKIYGNKRGVVIYNVDIEEMIKNGMITRYFWGENAAKMPELQMAFDLNILQSDICYHFDKGSLTENSKMVQIARQKLERVKERLKHFEEPLCI